MKHDRGFTLIELMIVIAIIAIIAAIAIPNLLDARKAANEASAIASLRAIHSAQNIYREQDKDGNGTLDFSASLSGLNDEGLLDAVLGGGTKQGYLFTPNGATKFTWSAKCTPQEDGHSGDRRFFVDETAVIRSATTGEANELSPAIGK